jgi:lysophospholipase L1-like esterase
MVHKVLPETQILVLSIKPSIARQKLWPQMQEANALIAELAKDDDQLEFVDIAIPMLAGANLPPSDLFLNDGLHLTANGYKLWDKTLTPALEKVMMQPN